MTEIVKVQLPMSSNLSDLKEMALVYAKDRKNLRQQSIPHNVMILIAKDRKGFFNATWSSTVGWAVVPPRLEDEDW